MNSIISICLIISMMISCFFGSFAKTADDILSVDNTFNAEQLTVSQVDVLKEFISTETSWIASLQLENGAIPMYKVDNGEVTVNPYFADISALALLENPAAFSENVKKYLDWHFSHLNSSDSDYNGISGTIYDYVVTVKDGRVVSENIILKNDKQSYDSTDSYAATFLILLNKYYTVTGDILYIQNHSEDIIRVTEAMLSTLNKGLTYAKPDYEVKYLMDNCEVYEGLCAVLNLFDEVVFSDECSLIYAECKYALKLMGQAIENKLWNEDTGYYYSGIFSNDKPAYDFSWKEFYPSATSQLFPVVHGIIPSDSVRAVSLYKNFCAAYDWQHLEIPSVFCWSVIALAAAKINDIDSILTFIDSYKIFAEERNYPLYNADSARVCLAAAELVNN